MRLLARQVEEPQPWRSFQARIHTGTSLTRFVTDDRAFWLWLVSSAGAQPPRIRRSDQPDTS